MRMIQTVVGAVVVAAAGLWLVGGYDAAGIEGIITSWVEMFIRLVMVVAMVSFFLVGINAVTDAIKHDRARDALTIALVTVLLLFAMPVVARMATVGAAKELNQTLIESEPFIDTSAQNVVRIIRQSETVLDVPATPTAVPTAMEPIITDLLATPEPTQQAAVIVVTATLAPTATRQVIEVPYDIREWNPATPPPKPED